MSNYKNMLRSGSYDKMDTSQIDGASPSRLHLNRMQNRQLGNLGAQIMNNNNMVAAGVKSKHCGWNNSSNKEFITSINSLKIIFFKEICKSQLKCSTKVYHLEAVQESSCIKGSIAYCRMVGGISWRMSNLQLKGTRKWGPFTENDICE